MFLEISENSQENTHARISFLIKLQAFITSLVHSLVPEPCDFLLRKLIYQQKLFQKECFIVITSVWRPCFFDWRFKLSSGDSAPRWVSCVTGMKGSRVAGVTVIVVVSVVWNESFLSNFLLISLTSSSTCRNVLISLTTQTVLLVFLS